MDATAIVSSATLLIAGSASDRVSMVTVATLGTGIGLLFATNMKGLTVRWARLMTGRTSDEIVRRYRRRSGLVGILSAFLLVALLR